MVLIDTSALVTSLCADRPTSRRFLDLLHSPTGLNLPAIVVYEWRRGPRTEGELAMQEQFLPSVNAIPFGSLEAAAAAEIYRRISRPRSREMAIAIAATAISRNAGLWTLNPDDFSDIPGLKLV